jgi:hypothetical protein
VPMSGVPGAIEDSSRNRSARIGKQEALRLSARGAGSNDDRPLLLEQRAPRRLLVAVRGSPLWEPIPLDSLGWGVERLEHLLREEPKLCDRRRARLPLEEPFEARRREEAPPLAGASLEQLGEVLAQSIVERAELRDRGARRATAKLMRERLEEA